MHQIHITVMLCGMLKIRTNSNYNGFEREANNGLFNG
jgi:hypothetical protein